MLKVKPNNEIIKGYTPNDVCAVIDTRNDGCETVERPSEKRGGATNKAESSHMQDNPKLTSSRRDKSDLGRAFQIAVGAHDWALADSFIPLADFQRLNDSLCVALDSIWFLSSQQELTAATKLIERLVEFGAHDFSRATLRTSFLASCVSACRSRAMGLADTVTVMAQR